MPKTVLITGGAGFVGSHLADELLARGYRVRILDNLAEQVHGPGDAFPDYLDPAVETRHGDIRDPRAVREALAGVSAVVHLAAAVGVGQSMYEIHHYTDTNNIGTAVLLEALLEERGVERLVVASSMSIYGEGLYRNRQGEFCIPEGRDERQLRAACWELNDSGNQALAPLPTPEEKEPRPASVYALSKLDQERMCLLFGRAYKLPAVALRFFNIYGPRQALSNPYTGVLAIFAARYLNGKAPQIFEDGRQLRDFVNVHDVAVACRLALENPQAAGQVFNIGSGESRSILDLARQSGEVLGAAHLEPEITGRYRVGDIRHCFADIGKARRVLGYRPRVGLAAGLTELAGWLEGASATDATASMREELDRRGLTV